jgi:hypothetical protein
MTSRLFAIIVVEEMGLTRHLKLKVLKCRKESEIRLPGWKLYDAKIMKRQVIMLERALGSFEIRNPQACYAQHLDGNTSHTIYSARYIKTFSTGGWYVRWEAGTCV